ncbi:MAG TPA: isoaspartyl peptidase/L-asparaginase, partial [Variovorax sp.]
MQRNSPVIAIHGGAGTVNAAALDAAAAQRYHDALRDIVLAAQALLLQGAGALDAVCLAVAMLEDCPLFNAGHGAVFTADETHELDAAVMNGADLAAGAVAGVSRIKSPVRAARAVMEDGQHVLMAGAGAEAFALQHGLEMVDP